MEECTDSRLPPLRGFHIVVFRVTYYLLVCFNPQYTGNNSNEELNGPMAAIKDLSARRH